MSETARVAELWDREQIRDLISSFMLATDAKDWAAWSELVTGDVTLTTPTVELHGREAAVAAQSARQTHEMLHLNAGTVVTVDGDEARGESYLRFLAIGTPAGDADVAGIANWTLRREAGRWRVASMHFDQRWKRVC